MTDTPPKTEDSKAASFNWFAASHIPQKGIALAAAARLIHRDEATEEETKKFLKEVDEVCTEVQATDVHFSYLEASAFLLQASQYFSKHLAIGVPEGFRETPPGMQKPQDKVHVQMTTEGLHGFLNFMDDLQATVADYHPSLERACNELVQMRNAARERGKAAAAITEGF